MDTQFDLQVVVKLSNTEKRAIQGSIVFGFCKLSNRWNQPECVVVFFINHPLQMFLFACISSSDALLHSTQ
jgi:hypothetical protein